MDLSVPVQEDELETFRSNWREEIQQHRNAQSPVRERESQRTTTATTRKSASPVATRELASPRRSLEKEPLVLQEETPLEIYENAILKERQGSLSEAVMQYRKAFKMDPDVDKHYKAKYFSPASGTSSSKSPLPHIEEIQSGYSTQEYRGTDHSDGISAITRDLRSLSIIQIEPEDPDLPCYLSSLPDELLLNILLHLSLSSLSSLLGISLVCKKLYQLAQDENSLYKTLCIHYFRPFLPASVLLSRSAEYNFDYRRMLIERPRLRFDGIYIATCHYIRPGVNDAAWNTPIHMVTYFRYVRFYPEGGCITVLTTSEPREVVHHVGWGSGLKGVSDGVWRMSESGEVRIRVSGPRGYSFVKDLQSTARGKHNKLVWVGFNSVHQDDGELTALSMKNEKSFYFSKVRSYENQQVIPTKEEK